MNRNRELDIKMTRRALELAAMGHGNVSPGPLVGCVIVSGEGEIVGEGTYYFNDVTHAEISALDKAGDKASGGTAYISLEPHSHHGRTPPCTKALIESNIARVVAPIEDPNPLVSGKGFEVLRENGIEVEIGLLSREAEIQNEKFIHWHRAGRPFVHLKAACSLDGRIATKTGDSKWITGEEARKSAHELRHEYDAILVGANTAAVDDPSLTDRSGLQRHRPLKRIILDSRLKMNISSKIALSASEIPTIVFADVDADEERRNALVESGIEVVKLKGGGHDLEKVLKILKEKGVQSVLVEGGATVSGSFMDNKLVDKMTFFVAPIVIGGKDAPCAIGGTGPESLSDAVGLRDVVLNSRGADFELTGYPAFGDLMKGKESG